MRRARREVLEFIITMTPLIVLCIPYIIKDGINFLDVKENGQFILAFAITYLCMEVAKLKARIGG